MINNKYYLNKKGVFLKGNIPSLKNSKEIQTYKKWVEDPDDNNSKILKKFNRLAPSKTVEKYYKEYEHKYLEHRVDIMNLFKGDNIWHMGLYYVRDSKRKFDFNNASQIIQDLMVKHNYLPDDNMEYLYPYPIGYHVNPDNPGVWICNVKDLISSEYILEHFERIIDESDTPLSQSIDHALYAISEIKKLKKLT